MKQRRWDIVHTFEEKENSSFLRKLSIQKSFKIMESLYQAMLSIKKKSDIVALNPERIRVLSKVHSIFNKVQ